MDGSLFTRLSRRESQIVDVVYSLGEASVADVMGRMRDAPSYDAVRVTLGILERKGVLKHRRDGRRYLYSPVTSVETTRRREMAHYVATFFGGSATDAILTLLGMSSRRLSDADLDEISRWIDEAREADR